MIDKTKQIIFTYVITNKINGKQYVGMHRLDDDVADDDYLGSGSYFSLALKKYGKDSHHRNQCLSSKC